MVWFPDPMVWFPDPIVWSGPVGDEHAAAVKASVAITAVRINRTFFIFRPPMKFGVSHSVRRLQAR